MELVLATRNAHKLAEFRRILAPAGIDVIGLPDEVTLPPEDGATFADNALPKARTAAAALGRPAIADDSGIEAAALGGRPGVHSARYAGEEASDEDNLAKLIAHVPEGSGLRYVCALAYVDPATRTEVVLTGTCSGTMGRERRGNGGFGYDPVFVPDAGPDRPAGAPRASMAELSEAGKDAISHRGDAIRQLIAWFARA